MDNPARLACNVNDPRFNCGLLMTLETHLLTRLLRVLEADFFVDLRDLELLLRDLAFLRAPPKIGRPPDGRPDSAFMTNGVAAAPRIPHPAERVASPRPVPTNALGTIFSDV